MRAMDAVRRRRRRAPAGSSPGTLIPDPHAHPPLVRIISYGPDGVHEFADVGPAEARALVDDGIVTWIDVSGLGDHEVLVGFQEAFGLHRLAMEDVVNVHQRPKVEAYPGHLFVVSRMTIQGERSETEQLSLFLGSNFVLTFQERPGDLFDPVRERIRQKRGRIRTLGSDYLAYALLDATIDGYFPVLEAFSDDLEVLETEVVANATRASLTKVFALRRNLMHLRRSLWPQRESIGSLNRDPVELITDETRVYLRDCYDHVVQLIDIVETHRELASGLMDLYLSSLSHRMNEVMKVLTIIATIFIPLSFVVGLYGMNFDTTISDWNMPELGNPYGYPILVVIMLTIAVGMLVYFRRRGWLGGTGGDLSATEEDS